MAQKIQQASIFGRLGTGIGKGLAEQVPKEIERNRLASGLKALGEQKGLSPFQRFAGAVGVAHEYPQVIQSTERLLGQEAQANALAKFSQNQQPPPQQEQQPRPFPGQPQNAQAQPEKEPSPSITKGPLLEEVQEGYIPPTMGQRDQRAAKEYNANPERFHNNPEEALNWADQDIAQEEKRDIARTAQHNRLNTIQDNVVKRLKDQSERLNVQVPADLYSTIEDEAIQATKPRSEGGRGLTEQQAMKEYGDKLNDASRNFAKIDELGNWGITGRPAADTLRSIKSIQQTMEAMNQTDNMAKQMITKQKISPTLAYGLSEPVHRIPALNQEIKKLPTLEQTHTAFESSVPYYVSVPATQLIAPRLAEYVKNNPKASPLAIAYEIQKKGYDADTFLQYLTDHPELNMKQRQKEQVDTPRNLVTPWNDWWLSSFSGIE